MYIRNVQFGIITILQAVLSGCHNTGKTDSKTSSNCYIIAYILVILNGQQIDHATDYSNYQHHSVKLHFRWSEEFARPLITDKWWGEEIAPPVIKTGKDYPTLSPKG